VISAALSESDQTFYATVAQVVPVMLLAFVIEFKARVLTLDLHEKSWDTVRRVATAPMWRRRLSLHALAKFIYRLMEISIVMLAITVELLCLLALGYDNSPDWLHPTVSTCLAAAAFPMVLALLVRVGGTWLAVAFAALTLVAFVAIS
jgi:hypothetical protein